MHSALKINLLIAAPLNSAFFQYNRDASSKYSAAIIVPLSLFLIITHFDQ
jgi:hypothetical protein